MSKYKKLMGNSLIFAIGNLSSKMISFVLVPLYTYYLSTKEYGQVDLITNTTSLLLPIFSGGIAVAVLRYALDKESRKEVVVSNAVIISIVGIALSFILYPVLKVFGAFQNSLFFFVLLLSLQLCTQVLAQFARGNKQVKVFAFNGVLKTLTIALTNILLLVQFHLGLTGYLISLVLAEVFSFLYLAWRTPFFNYFNLKFVDKTFIKEMLGFSLPTIPNDVLWWFVNSSSRYFIRYFLGLGANGIYAVANKIPSIISMMQSVFSQAWQISLVDESDSESKEEFHAKTFQYYSFLLFFIASGVIMILKPLLGHLIAKAYYTSWQVTPFLIISAIYSGFIGFYGQFYIAEKKTRGLMNTSIVSGIISIVSNFVFVYFFGLIGIGCAAMLSLFIGWMIRIYDTKKFVNVKINWRNIVFNHIVLALQIIALFTFNGWLLLGLEFICFCLFLIVNSYLIKETYTLLKISFAKKRK